MGTLLSPSSCSAPAPVKEKVVVKKLLEVPEEKEKKKKRHSVLLLLHALRCKKRLLTLGSKQKVEHRQAAPEGSDTGRTDRHRSIHTAGPTIQKEMCIRRVVVQASTGELLRCLSDFLRRRCVKLKEFPPNQIIFWFRNVDRVLLQQGWQNQCFLNPSSLVFVYLLCRDTVDEDTASEQELHATFLTCLYLAYCYLGNEISYPMKPFLVESTRDVFWERALEVVERLSGDMLRINAEPGFFTEVFQDLKRQGGRLGAAAAKKQRPADSGTEDVDR